MRFLSVCSGIEAASVAWNPLGWKAAAFSEIEPFPCAVLSHHYPDTSNLGDMTKYKDWPDVSVELLCGGTPCQSFSAAGLRAGLDDPRGELMLTFGAIAARYRPRWLVWENVPGVLSSNGGRDFGAFLGLLGHIGYGFAYRVLDAQFVRVDGYGRAVPQRRQRVFVVGCLGDWRSAAAVLLERESLRGDPAPRREAGKGFASGVADCLTKCRASSPDEARGTNNLVAFCLNAKGGGGRLDGESETLIPTNGGVFDAHAFDARQSDVLQYGDKTGPLDTDGQSIGVAIPIDTMNHLGRGDSHSFGDFQPGAPSYTLTKGHSHAVAALFIQDDTTPKVNEERAGYLRRDAGGEGACVMTPAMQVRRLTPVECERLQGFPDHYTAIPWRGKPADQCPDGPRYKALGNSWAVNCARWIGRRIAMVDAIKNQHREAA